MHSPVSLGEAVSTFLLQYSVLLLLAWGRGVKFLAADGKGFGDMACSFQLFDKF